MKNLILILFLLGITIIFNAENNNGVVYINQSKTDATLILQPSLNRVTAFDSDGHYDTVTYTLFLKMFKDENKEFGKEGIRAIITPFTKEEPKVIY
jgi:hypothetical protein